MEVCHAFSVATGSEAFCLAGSKAVQAFFAASGAISMSASAIISSISASVSASPVKTDPAQSQRSHVTQHGTPLTPFEGRSEPQTVWSDFSPCPMGTYVPVRRPGRPVPRLDITCRRSWTERKPVPSSKARKASISSSSKTRAKRGAWLSTTKPKYLLEVAMRTKAAGCLCKISVNVLGFKPIKKKETVVDTHMRWQHAHPHCRYPSSCGRSLIASLSCSAWNGAPHESPS